MKRSLLNKTSLFLGLIVLASCKALPPSFVTEIPVLVGKKTPLSLVEKKNWSHRDPYTDSIPGMGVAKAYAYINAEGMTAKETIVVAVLDSGIDLFHEDLSGMLWTNKTEVADNGLDDDGNGYVDDIHGYNFLGDSYNEQVEVTRIVAQKLGDVALQEKAKKELDKAFLKALGDKAQYQQILQATETAHADFKKAFGQDSYNKEDLENFETNSIMLKQKLNVLTQMFTFVDSIPQAIKEIKAGVAHFSEMADYNLNINFNGRELVGDNPYDISETTYGNGNPKNSIKEESHGTHVAGIVAAQRNNSLGANGVAQDVKIMAIRAVPNGDEYDKDIALGIRYAVDNGAKIINASFGKSYSPNVRWVYEAIKYAAEKNVLIVHAAGNEGENLDEPSHPNFPNDQINNGPEISDNVITVGALGPIYGENLVAEFSNYGLINVDIFAPGADIYASMPDNEYDFQDGTSMAAPGLAGVAALVWSHYPALSASQLKKVLMLSGVRTQIEVSLPSEPEQKTPFNRLSVSGRMVNAYNALILAKQIANKKLNINTYDFNR